MADSTKPDPFRYTGQEFSGLRTALDRLVNDSLLRHSLVGGQGGLAVDVYERDGTTVVEASLPGYSRDEIELQLEHGALLISATHDEEQEQRTRTYFRRERRFGAVSRRVVLPGVRADAVIEAAFRDGVLRVEIEPSMARASRPIEVKDG